MERIRNYYSTTSHLKVKNLDEKQFSHLRLRRLTDCNGEENRKYFFVRKTISTDFKKSESRALSRLSEHYID